MGESKTGTPEQEPTISDLEADRGAVGSADNGEVLGPISDLGRRYLDGELRQRQLGDRIEPSHREEVPYIEDFSEVQRNQARKLGRQTLVARKVAFGVLAAGASSRMDLQQLPPEVADLLRTSGRSEFPISKALVPAIRLQGETLNYLDLFLLNVARFQQQSGVDNHLLLFTSERNRGEIVEHLEQVAYRGLSPDRVLIFEQPLAPQIVATVEDVTRFERNFSEVDFSKVQEFSAQHAGRELPTKKPAGHGEFLHQLVASGMVGELIARGIQFVSIRNIDNVASTFDDTWMTALGHMIGTKAQMLAEVSQRPQGQKGGALVRDAGAWQLAEDPSFRGTGLQATDSYYINNATAILRLEYLYSLYDTDRETIRRLHPADTTEVRRELEQIAEQGRRKFPTIVEAKPVRFQGRSVGAVTPETNLWESTGLVPGLRLEPLAVHSDRDAGDDLLDLPPAMQRQRALSVRFSPTKSWSDYQDPRKRCIAQHICERILDGDLLSPDVASPEET